MSYEENLQTISLVAVADESDNQYLCVKPTAGGFEACDTAGEASIGILQNNPGLGKTGTIAFSGVSKVRAGAAVAVGAKIQAGSDGRGITAVNDDYVIGTALEAATAANNVIAVLIQPQGLTAPAAE